MELSGNILILAKEILSSEVLETLNENLPEFSFINLNPNVLKEEDLDNAVLIVSDIESMVKTTEKFENYKNFPPTLLKTVDPKASIKGTLEDFIYDTFTGEDPSPVVYRRIRNALFFSLKMKEQKESEIIETDENKDRVRKILNASKNMIPLRDTESSINRILTTAAGILNCEGGMIFLVEKESQIFSGYNQKLFKKKMLDGPQEFALDEGIPGWVYNNKATHISNDTSMDSLFSEEYDKRFGIKSESVLAYPLIADSVVLGVLRMYNRKNGGKFTEEDEALLKEISEISTQIIQNTNYFENHSNFFVSLWRLT